ncbi:MAG: hypothetical protein GY926_05425 [bacterium]|nr:hypothetical protein [bacterium]MCP4964655.1 hypothetical protein [bacterium]
MHLAFDETFAITPAEAYDFYKTPADWPRLFKAFTKVTDRGDGWYTVWIKRTPIPLIAKITVDEPDERVAWDFRGTWSGDGAVRFELTDTGTRITGHETIALPRLLQFMERHLESGFAAVWEGGWRRLRKRRTDAK